MDFVQSIPPKLFLLIGAFIVLGFAYLWPQNMPKNLKAISAVKMIAVVLVFISAIFGFIL